MKKILALALFLILSNILNAQWLPDVRLTTFTGTSNTSYCDRSVAVIGNTVHVVWYDDRDGNYEIYYKRSTDNGISWGADTRLTNNTSFSAGSGISVSGMIVHIVWYDGRDGNWEIYYKHSTDGGVTWGADTRLTNNPSSSLSPAVSSSGSYVYVLWDDNRDGNDEMYFKCSTDGGASWGTDTRLSNNTANSVAASIASTGLTVCAAWHDNRDSNTEIYYRTSTDGGLNWGAETRLTNNTASSEEPSVIVSGSDVHIVWHDNRDGNWEIYYNRSTDGGLSWGTDTRLTNNIYNSLWPIVTASESAVDVVWYDDRDGNTEIYFKRSTDLGLSWDTDTRLTNNSGGSSYPSVSASGPSVHVVWYDNRDGNYEVYYKQNPIGNTVAAVDSVSPDQNKINVPQISYLKAYFNQNMNSSTIDSNSIFFFGSMTGRKQGTFIYNSGEKSVTIDPNNNFKYGELISASLTSSIKTSSNNFITPFAWSFTASANPSNLVFNKTDTAAVGSNPIKITTGDLDGDGDLDIAVSNESLNLVTILKNNGVGTFTVSSTIGVGSSPSGIVMGDLDNDGDLDLAVANGTSNTVSILKNDGTGTFSLSSNITVGPAGGIVTGDIDGDGDLDIVVTNRNSDNISILKNNGTGTFSISSTVAADSPQGIAIGDFDNDGDLDFAAAEYWAHRVSIFKNDGTGIFTLSTTNAVGSNIDQVVTGDFDNDGDLDLAVTNNGSGFMSILINNGTGTFTANNVGANGLTGITKGDFDGDGYLDLAVNNFGLHTVSIYKNNGTGTFALSSTIGAGNYPFYITAGDFNNDGVLDLAVNNYYSSMITVLMNLTQPLLISPANNSIGNLSDLSFTWNKSPGASGYRFQLAADSLFSSILINDSTLSGTDSVRLVSGLNALTWYYWRMNSKSPNGTSLWSDAWKFKTQGVPTQVNLYYPANNSLNQSINLTFRWYKAIDQVMVKNINFNEENKLDGTENISNYWFELSTDSLFTTGVLKDSLLADTTKTLIWLVKKTKYYWRVKAKNETGWGSFSSIWNFTTTYYIDSVSPGKNKINYPLISDIKAYFHQNMNSTTMDSNSITLFGSMTGRKRGTITYNSGNNSVRIIPYTPFKYGELISTTLDSGIRTGMGSPIVPFVWSFMTMAKPSNLIFNQTSTVGTGNFPYEITTGDFDGDGNLDLAVTNYSSNIISILKNNGTGTFTASSVVVGSSPNGIITGDLDGDGDLDLAVTNNSSSSVSILKNNGIGIFTVTSIAVGSSPYGITTGDFDGDGDLDLGITNWSSNSVQILKNNGTGVFTVSSTVGVGNLYNITNGDFDGDGYLDLAVGRPGANSVSILKNDGTGAFAVSSTISGISSPEGITPGDFDSDGDLDLAVANMSSNSVSILKNNGSGVFTVSSITGAGSGAYGITTGDLDGDGDLDLAVTNHDANSVSILKNNGTGVFTLPSTVGIGSYPYGITSGDFNNDGLIDLAPVNGSSNYVSILINLIPPQLLSPANNSTGNLSSVNFAWIKSPGASGYRIQIATDSLFNNLVMNDSTLPGTDSIKSVSGLNALTWYYWRMNSKSANGTSLWYDTWKFKTQGVPTQVVLSSPANNSLDQPINITFQWFKAVNQTFTSYNGNLRADISTSPLAIANYWFECSTDSTFSTGVLRDSTLTDTTKTLNWLAKKTKYYWRVKAKNETGWGEFSSTWNFTTTFYIDSVSPNQNKINVPLTSDLKAYFNQNMNGSTMDSNSIVFFGSMTGRKQGTFIYNSGEKSLTINPNNDFKYGELISTTLTSLIKTSSDNFIAPFVWSFTSTAKPSNLVFGQPNTIEVGTSPNGITTGDFDGDGYLDIAVANDGVTILKNNGTGAFVASSSVSINSPYGITTGDFDGDGDLDLAITNYASNTISILKNNGAGIFMLSSSVGVGNDPRAITSGDFDGDGYLDIAVANWTSNTVSILKNNGAGLFMLSSSIGVGYTPEGIATGDFDGDGDIDLAVSNGMSNTVSILKNNGTGVFMVSFSVGIGDYPIGITAGDFDGDDDLDLVVVNASANSVSILKNEGTGVFIETSLVTVGSTPYGIITGDFDGDDDVDLAVVNAGANTVSILKNNGTGIFTASSSVGVGSFPSAVTSGDFNNDGVLDIANINGNSNNVSILINLVPPLPVSPANNSTGNLSSLNFSWNKSLGASNYRFQLTTDSLFNNLVMNDSTLLGTDSVKAISGLNALTWYYWRMNSKSPNGTSLWSDTRKFKTKGSPFSVNLISPMNNAVNQPVSITFQWNKAIEQTAKFKKSKLSGDETDGVVAIGNYWFELVTDTVSMANLYCDTTLTDTTKSINGLTNQTNYYWRVKARNEIGWGGFSAWWRFTTIVSAPLAPVPVSPPNGAVGVPVPVTFVWHTSALAGSYSLQVALDSLFTNVVYNDTTITDTVKTISGLSQQTTYYWRVNAKNAGGTSSYSAVWSFTTQALFPTLTLKVYLEGFYAPEPGDNPVKGNMTKGNITKGKINDSPLSQVADTINIYLADSTQGYAFVDSVKVLLGSNGFSHNTVLKGNHREVLHSSPPQEPS